MLSEEMVEKYRVIYREEYGEDISKQEAIAQGNALLRLMEVIYRPLPRSDIEEAT